MIDIINKIVIEHGAFYSLVTRVVALAICIIFIIPLMLKQAKVKNGLRLLRYELLAYGIIHTFTNLFSLYFLFDVVSNGTPQKLINSWLQVANAACFLLLAVIGYLMYHGQYNEESIKHHKKISELERKEGKK